MHNEHAPDELPQAIADLIGALNRAVQIWLSQQGPDDLMALSGHMADGARAGVRFILPKAGEKPELAFLLADRAGEILTLAELDAIRSMQ